MPNIPQGTERANTAHMNKSEGLAAQTMEVNPPAPILEDGQSTRQNRCSRPASLAETVSTEPDLQSQENTARSVNCYVRLEALLDQLEKRVSNIDRRSPFPSSNSGSSSGSDSSDDEHSDSDSNTDKTKAEEDKKEKTTPRKKTSKHGLQSKVAGEGKFLPKVQECDWEHFVNRYSPEDGSSMIEVLVAGHQIGREVANEDDRRRGGTMPSWLVVRTVHRIDTHAQWIQRVRIQSKSLLDVFSRVTNYAWGTKPHTFVRPFQYLIHFHEDFKEELRRLESQAQTSAEESMQPAERLLKSMDSKRDTSDHGSEGSLNESSNSKEALEELRCYIAFAEERLLPQYRAFQDPNLPSPSVRAKVRFDDLWYLFRPGDLIYVPQETLYAYNESNNIAMKITSCTLGPGGSHQSWMYQKLWRLYISRAPEGEISPLPAGEPRPRHFMAQCYYLDFDGLTYGAVCRSFAIQYFEGEKDIRDLDFYPHRFVQNADEMLDSCRAHGRLFVDWVSKSHALYDGWTFVTNPAGIPIIDEEKNWANIKVQVRPRYIEGDVIIDFKEAINSHPDYQPLFNDRKSSSGGRSTSRTVDGRCNILNWSDTKRSKLSSVHRESVVTHDDCDTLEANALFAEDRYLPEASRSSQPPEGDDIVLLPPRIFVYALRYRKFFPVDCRRLRAVSIRQDAFETLQLPERHKRMIKAAVQFHTRRDELERQIEARGNTDIQTQDFIAGKGRGLLMLLHGEPGVGKTATAEAVAQTMRRPLFSIACSDLGEIDDVEERLNEIFRLAHHWKCVLLMDEADIFLSARSGSNWDNITVSIFLRRLEYYNGILFLTTNRIGKLDPALWSRIHLTLHYKRFGPSEMESIFRSNINRLRQVEQQQQVVSTEPPLFIMEQEILRFAADHYGKHPKGKGAWNGRQVRNAFSIAASLARYEAEDPSLFGKGFQPQLRYSHFQEVEKLTAEHDRFRAHILGGDDSRKARLNEERDDDYDDDDDTNDKVSDIANQLKIARLLYTDQTMRSRGQDINLGVGLANHLYTPPSSQHVTVPVESHFNQHQQQFAMSESKRTPSFPQRGS